MKNVFVRWTYTLFFPLILLVSCHKDEERWSTTQNTSFTAEVVEEITGEIIGYVYDKDGQPVADATVMTYSATTTTTREGLYYFKDIKLDKNGTFIKVLKSGYHLGSDMVYPSGKAAVHSYIQLLPLNLQEGFETSSGGKISLEGGGHITFKPHTISYENGDEFFGTVYYSAYFLSPEDKNLGDMMPGDLIGDAAEGNTVVLGTAGMMAVELRDKDGRELNLKPGALASVSLPNTLSESPSQIPTWSFDESKGRWKEENRATLQGDQWLFEVSHFSFWNCDAPFPLVHVCGRVLSEEGEPLSNISIIVQAEGLGTSWGYTDEDGYFCGKMPKGKLLTIFINGYRCAGSADIIADATVSAGPLDAPTTLDDIIISNENHSLEVTMLCQNQPVNVGILIARIGDRVYNFKAVGGKITLPMGYYNKCQNIDQITVTGFNADSNSSSVPVIVSTGQSQSLTLETCDPNCSLQVKVEVINCERLRVVATGGSGDYTYEWSTLETSQEILLSSRPDSSIYCVQVTDNITQCIQTSCLEVPVLSGWISNDCQSGVLQFQSAIPISDLTFLWSTGENTSSINVINVGDYSLTVTDSNGCTNEYSTYFGGFLFLDNNISRCQLNEITIESSFFEFGLLWSRDGIQKNLNFPIRLDIFEVGFSFWIEIGNGGECREFADISLPKLVDGLMTSVRNTSCAGCNDGQITINLDPNATCQNCTAGAVQIYLAGNYSSTVNTQNDNGVLAAGDYIVAVLDRDSGCVVAFQKVNIQ